MALNKIKVLLVDDQSLILDILTKNLIKDTRIEIVGTATNGAIALDRVEKLKPDVVVLDMEMPVMNGLQFLRKQMPANPVPTIILSSIAHRDSQITVDAFEAGAVDFLPKPSGGPMGLNKLIQQLWVKIKIVASKDVSYLKRADRPIIKPIEIPKSATLNKAAKSNKVILGMGAYKVTNDKTKELKIYALGSCVGLTLFCPSRSVVAMSHVVLPTSTTDEEKSKMKPGYFADTALSVMLKEMLVLGCTKDKIFAKIAGGAKTSVDVGNHFAVGERNGLAVTAQLMKHGIKLLSQEIGGNISRTVTAKPGDMNLTLHHPEKGEWKI